MTMGFEVDGVFDTERDQHISVTGCARCGEPHARLEFKRFQSPSRMASGGRMTHWSMCPVSYEPIFLIVLDGVLA